MLIQIANFITQIQLLPRLLYDFKEPFDKEKAFNDWKGYGGEAKLTFDNLLFFYKVEFDVPFNILNTVYSPYLDNESALIPPLVGIISDFDANLRIFNAIQNHWKFANEYKMDFSPFTPFSGDQIRILREWKKLRGKFIDHKANINNLFQINGSKEFKIPFRLRRFLEIAGSNLKDQRNAQLKNKKEPRNKTAPFPPEFKWDENDERIYHFGKFGSVNFTKHRSDKLKIFTMIVDMRGEEIMTRKIAHRINKNNHYVYSVIRALRKDIKHIKGVQIICTGTGYVKMTVSPSILVNR